MNFTNYTKLIRRKKIIEIEENQKVYETKRMYYILEYGNVILSLPKSNTTAE